MSTKKTTPSKKNIPPPQDPSTDNPGESIAKSKQKAPRGKKARFNKTEKRITIAGQKVEYSQNEVKAKLPLGKVIKDYAEGRSLTDIARQYNVTPSGVFRAIEPYRAQLDQLKEYRGAKDTWQDVAAHKILKAILEKDMEGERLSSLSQSYTQLNKAAREERGEFTGGNLTINLVDLSRFKMPDIPHVVSGSDVIIDIMADDTEN